MIFLWAISWPRLQNDGCESVESGKLTAMWNLHTEASLLKQEALQDIVDTEGQNWWPYGTYYCIYWSVERATFFLSMYTTPWYLHVPSKLVHLTDIENKFNSEEMPWKWTNVYYILKLF